MGICNINKTAITLQTHPTTQITMNRESYRRKLQRAGMKCEKVKTLRETCKMLNSVAGRVAYHVDHIFEVCIGGKDHIDNLWIVPAKWNEESAHRTMEMRYFIFDWIRKNGRVCLSIPQELLDMENVERIKILTEIGFTRRDK